MSERVNRFLGDTPARTIIKLIVVSLIVGFIMAYFRVDPYDIFHGLERFVMNLWYRGFDALGSIGRYLVLGATVVIPVFIIIRLMSARN